MGTTALASVATRVMSSSKVNCPDRHSQHGNKLKDLAYSIKFLSKTLRDSE